jgi:hypothetical protein
VVGLDSDAELILFLPMGAYRRRLT